MVLSFAAVLLLMICTRSKQSLCLALSLSHTDPLTDPPTLPDFLDFIATQIPAKWYEVGVALKIPSLQLDAFRIEHLNNSLRCYASVFESWRSSSPSSFSWSTIIKALGRPFINELSIADELKKRLHFFASRNPLVSDSCDSFVCVFQSVDSDSAA